MVAPRPGPPDEDDVVWEKTPPGGDDETRGDRDKVCCRDDTWSDLPGQDIKKAANSLCGSDRRRRLDRLVLKFTTASSEKRAGVACRTDGSETRIGRDPTLCDCVVASDATMAAAHAAITYDAARAAFSVRACPGRAGGDARSPLGGGDAGGALNAAATRAAAAPCVAVRVFSTRRSDAPPREHHASAACGTPRHVGPRWPLVVGANFSLASTVVRATRRGVERRSRAPVLELTFARGPLAGTTRIIRARGADTNDGCTSSSGRGLDEEPPTRKKTTTPGAEEEEEEEEEPTRKKTTPGAAEEEDSEEHDAAAARLKRATPKKEDSEEDPALLRIGRSAENDVCVPDRELSRSHCCVAFDAASRQFYVRDLGSTNGTYVRLDGPYAGSYRLALGDHILVGRTGFAAQRFDYGVAEKRGARDAMEDRSVVVQDLFVGCGGARGDDDGDAASHSTAVVSYAAVYDGHGGDEASSFLRAELHGRVAAELAAVCGPDADAGRLCDDDDDSSRAASCTHTKRTAASAAATQHQRDAVRRALTRAFLATDEAFMRSSERPQAGSTACAVVVGPLLGGPNKTVVCPLLACANVGDSRAVLATRRACRALSSDHTPARVDEAARIRAAGGWVIHRRVMGELAVSRAFGDAELKKSVSELFGLQKTTNPHRDADGERTTTTLGSSSSSLGRRPGHHHHHHQRVDDDDHETRPSHRQSCAAVVDGGDGGDGLDDDEDDDDDDHAVASESSTASVDGNDSTTAEDAEDDDDDLGRTPPLSPADDGPRGGEGRTGTAPRVSPPPPPAHDTDRATRRLVVAEPEVTFADLDAADPPQFVLLACDGLFDVFSDDEAVAFARAALARHAGDPQRAADDLARAAIHDRGSRDNVTVVLLKLA